jgi:hypothetical protein
MLKSKCMASCLPYSFDQADLPALPAGAKGPWRHVYAVNDLGNSPDSDAPVFVSRAGSDTLIKLGRSTYP